MLRLLILVGILYFSYSTWPWIKEKPVEIVNQHLQVEHIEELSTFMNSLEHTVLEFLVRMEQTLENLPEERKKEHMDSVKPELKVPAHHTFSVHNIEIGDMRSEVEQLAGSPKRSTRNEYGTNWVAYHSNYQNFLLVSYNEDNEVAGLYTNQDLIASTKNLSIGTSQEEVIDKLGKPLTSVRKGFLQYQLNGDRDYDLFEIDDSYVTVFYDKHQQQTLSGIQIISLPLENQKTNLYPRPSDELIEGFQYQLFDLTNAARVKHGLSLLTWDDHVMKTAQNHSKDMALNAYFSHTNLHGQSPFDRMKEDDIFYTMAGENLAFGQFSSIFAHQGLMNSLGHRENILKDQFEFLGVGVAFNSEGQPYFTEKFYRD